MEDRRPKAEECYRHFKGKRYQVLAIAKHSETLEEMVVYRQLYGEREVYVRPLEMFVSKVDHEKYPDVQQEYRFELETDLDLEDLEESKVLEESNKSTDELEETPINVSSMIMDFLDLRTTEEKIEFLLKVKNDITENFIEIVAQSLDFVENDGSLEERYEALIRYLKTVARYESGRLR